MSPTRTCLVTGATGFIGSHLAEACLARGWQVRTLVRPTSDTRLLERLGVTLIPGDIVDPDACREAVAGADVVVHAAAKVGDWGDVDTYRIVNVEGLRNLLEACRGRPIARFIQLSSLGVYAARHHHGTDETEPAATKHIDGYTQSKAEAEQLALGFQRDAGIPVVVLRPGFVYGPRDRTILPRLVDGLRRKQLRYLGGAQRVLNTLYVGNLVEAVFLAVENPGAIGQIFNLTDSEPVTRQRFLETIAERLELPKPRVRPVPLWFPKALTWYLESAARRRGDARPPRLTQARLKFLCYNLDFSTARAQRELGYRPRYTFEDGMREALAEYLSPPAKPLANNG